MRLTKWMPIAALLGTTGCVVTPHVVTYYDALCDVEYRKMELSVQPFNLLTGGPTYDQNCGPLLAAYALVPPVSAVVSGSIVLVGNSVFWMERTRECIS